MATDQKDTVKSINWPKLSQSLKWSNINSSELVTASSVNFHLRSRLDFFDPAAKWRAPPPLVACSHFVPPPLVAHLMRLKKDSALGVKYRPGDHITNMEAALHTWVTPIAAIKLLGDYRWAGLHAISLFPSRNALRRVLLAASVHLDFETPEVWRALCRLPKSRRFVGAPLPPDFRVLSAEEKMDPALRAPYEAALRAHIVHHVSLNGFIPARSEVPHSMLPLAKAVARVERLVEAAKTPGEVVAGVRYLFVGDGLDLCVELMFQALCFQLFNELTVYRNLLPQGCIELYDPPRIFAQMFGGDSLLIDRLRILAYKHLALSHPSLFDTLRYVAFNDFADPRAVDLLRMAFATVHTRAVSKAALYLGPEETYSGPPEGEMQLALIIKNNSDAFGQNIETEGPGASLDGVIGSYSDASLSLLRHRTDLLKYIITCEYKL